METLQIEFPIDWIDYELIDSGDGMKLERFGKYTIARTDPRAIWTPRTQNWSSDTPPAKWNISYNHLTFILKPTQFKHVGIFPEQVVNWNWLKTIIDNKPLKILNLFAYTGGATMAAAAAGAQVTHVDAAGSAIDWAHENVRASNLSDKPIRWIEEDAMKFILREAKRGNSYDGIIMDPPRFGRGTKGEVWKLEDDLPKLLSACKNILSTNPAFILLNAYTADLSSIAIGNLLETHEFGELALRDSFGTLLPSGIFARLTFGQPR